MKTLKIFLTAYLLFHFTLVLMVNLMAMTILKEKDERLNNFGQSIVKIIEKPNFAKFTESSLGLYLNVTGVNTGYEYFSPNVFKGSIKLFFESDTGQKLNMFRSIESQMKYITFSLFFNASLTDKEKRQELMKSVCRRLFTKNEGLDEVHVYMDVKIYDDLEKSKLGRLYDDKGKILLSKISKPSHEKNSI